MAEYPLLGTVLDVPSDQRDRIFAAVPAGSTSTTEAAGLVPESPALHPAAPAAAWSPNVDALTGTALQAAAERCLGSVSSLLIAPPTEPHLRVLGEARGSSETVLIASSSRVAFRVGSGRSLVTGTGVDGGDAGSEALVVDGAPGGLNGADATRAVYGRIGVAVVTVRLETADHRHLTASAAGGRSLPGGPRERIRWRCTGTTPLAVRS